MRMAVLLPVCGGLLAAPAAAAPGYGMAPAIAGTPWVGQTLTVRPADWSDPGAAVTVSDEWQACDINGTCAPLGFGARYQVSSHDLGATIQVVETALAAGDGSATATAAAVGPVTYQAPSIRAGALPVISGVARPGETLTAGHGAWSPDPSAYSDQWRRCDATGAGCADIAGATGQTYTATPQDAGSTLQVREVAYDQSVAGAPADSSPTATVQASSDVSLTASPTHPSVNQPVTLSATVSSETAGTYPSGTVAFLAGGTVIAGCANVAVNGSGESVTVLCTTTLSAPSTGLAATFTAAAGSAVAGSTSPTVTLAVAPDVTSLTLHAIARVTAATRVVLTATVAPPPGLGGPRAPAGSVAFTDRGHPLAGCASRPVVKHVAACAVTWYLGGRHTIAAVYSGDADFRPSHAGPASVTVLPIPVRGRVTATMRWEFYFTPSYTTVMAMVLSGVPYGATIQLGCHGPGCPFTVHRQMINPPAACRGSRAAHCVTAGPVSLLATVANHQLAPGVQLTVMVAHPNDIGKYYSFTMRARSQPQVQINCLAPASPLPGRGCTLR